MVEYNKYLHEDKTKTGTRYRCHSFGCGLFDFTDGKKQKESCRKTRSLKCFPFYRF